MRLFHVLIACQNAAGGALTYEVWGVQHETADGAFREACLTAFESTCESEEFSYVPLEVGPVNHFANLVGQPFDRRRHECPF